MVFKLKLFIAGEIGEILVDTPPLYSLVSKYFHSFKTDKKATFKVALHFRKRKIEGIVTKEKTKNLIDIYYDERYLSDEHFYIIIITSFQYLLAQKKIIFFHASSGLINSKGCIFCAPSGTGKSTLIKKLSPEKITSDDIAIVKKEDKDKYYLYYSPFDKKKTSYFSEKCFPAKNIFLLKRGKKTRMIETEYPSFLYSILEDNFLLKHLSTILNKKKRVKTLGIIVNTILDFLISSRFFTLDCPQNFDFQLLEEIFKKKPSNKKPDLKINK